MGRGVPCTCRENFTVLVFEDASASGASRARVRCVGEFGAEAGDSAISRDTPNAFAPSDCWK